MAPYHAMMAHFPVAVWITASMIIVVRALSDGPLAKSLDRVLVPFLVFGILTGVVTYVFGHRLPASGRCVSTKKELRQLAAQAQGELTAYVVEACPACRWHHLLRVLPLSG